MGKAVVIGGGGTGNSAWGNKFDDTDDLPWALSDQESPDFSYGECQLDIGTEG
jgi:hypothetical protein